MADSTNEVSWPTIFWAIMAIATNSMVQPRILSPKHKDEAKANAFDFFSPVACAVDIIITWGHFLESLYLTGPSLKAFGLLASITAPRPPSSAEQPDDFRDLQNNPIFRGVIFALGALPQFIKLMACSGIPWFKTWAALQFGAFLLHEGLVAIPGHFLCDERREEIVISHLQTRDGTSQHPETEWPHANDRGVIYSRCFTILIATLFQMRILRCLFANIPWTVSFFVRAAVAYPSVLVSGLMAVVLSLLDPKWYAMYPMSQLYVGTLLAYLVWVYDGKETNKPAWTEYLG